MISVKLDFWLKHSKNVLFIGKHGVGKTAMVKEAFDRHQLNWRYFSASTMDPWVDFVGVPQAKNDNKLPSDFEIIKELASISPELAYEYIENNWKMSKSAAKNIVEHTLNRPVGFEYLSLVRPQTFNGEVEALFFDEFNRSPKKVRNAVMELIQFKSINGMKFPKLKVVWAAINPDDEDEAAAGLTYDVEKLDPAQSDRFHIKVEVPYKPNAEWFRQKYPPRIVDAAIQWWDELSEENKDLVSPRRLEYALDMYEERGDMRDVLPVNSNVSKLTSSLNQGPITEKLDALKKANDAAETRSFLQNENNYSAAMKYISKSESFMEYFVPLLPKEKLGVQMNEDDKICNFIISQADKVPNFKAACKEIITANTNARLAKKIRRALQDNQDLAVNFANSDGVVETAEPHFNKRAKNSGNWSDDLTQLKTAPADTANQKILIYDKIISGIPERQSAAEALQCLELLDQLFSDKQWTSSITAKPFDKLINVINHCIAEIHRNTGHDWTTILTTHGSHFKGLLEKIKLSGLSSKLYTP